MLPLAPKSGNAHRRRLHGKVAATSSTSSVHGRGHHQRNPSHSKTTATSPPPQSSPSASHPIPRLVDTSMLANTLLNNVVPAVDSKKKTDDTRRGGSMISMMDGSSSNNNSPRHHLRRKQASFRKSRKRRSRSTTSNWATANAISGVGKNTSCWEWTGLNFICPTLLVWTTIILFVWWNELKDNALDYYYLYYPEEQPMSQIPGTVLPLLPNVWFYDPDKDQDSLDASKKQKMTDRQQQVRHHLKEHQQPHYYMLPQDFYNQQTPFNSTSDFDVNSNTALEAPPIRGILVVLHPCHHSGLHFFQLPESRIVAAHALQRGLAIFSPTASAAPKLITMPAKENDKKAKDAKNKNTKQTKQPLMGAEKNCWSASLDGDELLGPLLYEWARELQLTQMPRMALGIANGANLLMASSLYKPLRLQSMALYASHHPSGFRKDDLDRDVVPATAFLAFPKSAKATEIAIRNYHTLLQHHQEDEPHHQTQQQVAVPSLAEEDEDDVKDATPQKPKSFPNTQLWKLEPHPFTPTLCQERLPEYHTRCRSFFRHVKRYQQSKMRKQELKAMKQDPAVRTKRQRLGGGYAAAKQKYQLLTSLGEVVQSSKSPQWIPVMKSLGLDDWTTHTMAFTMHSVDSVGKKGSAKLQNAKSKYFRQKKSQLVQFPTMATAEGRSWLWASMLQEIEAAYGVQEMTSERATDVLDFLMYHAGLPI